MFATYHYLAMYSQATSFSIFFHLASRVGWEPVVVWGTKKESSTLHTIFKLDELGPKTSSSLCPIRKLEDSSKLGI
jgi:hypothetical protein